MRSRTSQQESRGLWHSSCCRIFPLLPESSELGVATASGHEIAEVRHMAEKCVHAALRCACGTEFTPSSSRQRFCCGVCRQAAYRKRNAKPVTDRTCHCGRPVQVVGQSRNKHCSESCRQAAVEARLKARRLKRRLKWQMEKNKARSLHQYRGYGGPSTNSGIGPLGSQPLPKL
jgi:hypothetical protein